jgi:chromosome segregation ATPase
VPVLRPGGGARGDSRALSEDDDGCSPESGPDQPDLTEQVYRLARENESLAADLAKARMEVAHLSAELMETPELLEHFRAKSTRRKAKLDATNQARSGFSEEIQQFSTKTNAVSLNVAKRVEDVNGGTRMLQELEEEVRRYHELMAQLEHGIESLNQEMGSEVETATAFPMNDAVDAAIKQSQKDIDVYLRIFIQDFSSRLSLRFAD